MSKFKITLIVILGIFLEIVNYLLVYYIEKYFEIGLRLAGMFIIFISIFGSIGYYYYWESRGNKQ